MSYYLDICVASHTDIAALFNENLESIISRLELKNETEKAAKLNLLAKNYTRDPETLESPDAIALIYAFEKLVAIRSKS